MRPNKAYIAHVKQLAGARLDDSEVGWVARPVAVTSVRDLGKSYLLGFGDRDSLPVGKGAVLGLALHDGPQNVLLPVWLIDKFGLRIAEEEL